MNAKTSRCAHDDACAPEPEAATAPADSAAAPAPEGAPESPAPSPAEPDARDDRIAELQNQLLRLQADFDNFRKRTARERLELSQAANESLLLDLLPVVDHYEMGLATAEKQKAEPAVIQGFRLVFDQLLGVLRRSKVEAIAAEGAPFDPHLHEAITHLPSEEHAADTVIAETRRGYRIGERLLRAAQVVVSSGPAAPTQPASAQPGAATED